MEYILWMRGLKYVVLGDCESNLIQTITLGTYESVHLPETKDWCQNIDVKEIQTKYGPGKVGKLSDGTTVVARPGSTTGGATLEIRVSNRKVYKIRYQER